LAWLAGRAWDVPQILGSGLADKKGCFTKKHDVFVYFTGISWEIIGNSWDFMGIF
jgi:hypothetical protein